MFTNIMIYDLKLFATCDECDLSGSSAGALIYNKNRLKNNTTKDIIN